MTEKLLVTGGCGFIGANFIRFVLANRPKWSITNLDSLTYSGNLDNLIDVAESDRYTFVKGDIRDAALVTNLIGRADAVVHFAAESHVDRSIENASRFVETNVLGTQVLLDAARTHPTGRFLQVGTDEVYGSLPLDRPDLKFTEDTPIAPNSPYSASKAGADFLVRAYNHTYGLDTVTTRCSNNFGPYQFPEKVIPLFVTNLMEGRKVPLYGDGKNVRDWLHVEDHCEAILAALEHGRSGEIYNIGGDNERSNLEMTHQILSALGQSDDMIQYVEDRLGHDRRYAVDSGKIQKDLGWRPTRSQWPEALQDTVKWYSDHRAWWERVKSGAYRDSGSA